MLFLIAFVLGALAQSLPPAPPLPTFGKDYQMIFEVNIPSQNISNDFVYIHAGSLGFSRFEFQSGGMNFVHIANVPANARVDVWANDTGANWNCLPLAFNSTRGFGVNGLTGQNASLGDTGILGYFFRGTGQTFNQIFNFALNRTETYLGQSDVRGIWSDGWTTTFPIRGNTTVTREFFFSAQNIIVNGNDVGRVPVRSVTRGANNTFYTSFEFVRFLPFLPPQWRYAEMFGDCFTMRNVAAANAGDDDDDHHDDVNIPPLPSLPQNFTMVVEVNMFSHNTSFAIKYWQYANQSRVDYESGGQWWTDVMDGVAGQRYEYPTAAPLNCTQMALNATTPFGGESPGVLAPNNISSMWNGQEDDDDDLIEEFFYRVAMAQQTLYQLFSTNQNMTQFKGQRNVRGIRCDQWRTTMTTTPFWLNQPCNLTVDFYISSLGVEFDGAFFSRVPVLVVLNGTVGPMPFYHQYAISTFLSYTPSAREQIGMFGNCSQQQLIYNALTQVVNNNVLPVVIANNVPGIVGLGFVVGVVIGILLALGAVWFRRREAQKKIDAPQRLAEEEAPPAPAAEAKNDIPLDDDDKA